MRVTEVPCRKDNYAYLLASEGSKEAIVVDPTDAAPVAQALEASGLVLRAILNTHHHADHVGGNLELLERYGALRVYGHRSDSGRIPGQNRLLDEGDTLDEVGLRFSVLHVPGHTLGAIAYVGEGAVFTGDTLFGAGCGRLFEGTAAMLHHSLNHKLASLSGRTQVYFGHEYTLKNLGFACQLEPLNQRVREAFEAAQALRDQGLSTVPSSIAHELCVNPFLRCGEPQVAHAVHLEGATPVEVFAALRHARDSY